MQAALKSIALKRQSIQSQPRDALGQWVSANREMLLTKAVATGAGLAGGALAGPVGAAAGQLLGGIAARQGIALGKAIMSDSDTAIHEELLRMGSDLQGLAQKAQDALIGVDKSELEDVMSKDTLGWAVAHAADYGLDILVPGAEFIPGKGAAVAALATGPIYGLKRIAKQKYDQKHKTSG